MRDEGAKGKKQQWPWGKGYQRSFQSAEQVEEIMELLRMEDAASLVDIGCGNGRFAIAAARLFPRCRVWACDPLESAIAECREQAGELLERNLCAIVAEAERMPLADACADRVLVRNVHHHLSDPHAGFEEMGRLLCPGGRIVLEGPGNDLSKEMGRLISQIHFLWDSSHRRQYYRPERIVGRLEDAGIEASVTDLWHYKRRVGAEAVRLIAESGAEGELRLERENEGGVITLAMLRIIGFKKASF